jgi:predicted permease
MLARALNRQHEVAIKLALGASRFAVCRTFLFEAMALSLAGGLLGIVAAVSVLPIIRQLAQGQIPRFDAAALNVRVLLFGLFASLVIAILFALPSYLRVFRAELNAGISTGNARGYSAGGSWLSDTMMVAEVALSLAVLLAAVMLVRSFSLTLQTKPGFDSNSILAVRAQLVEGDWPKSYSFFRNRVVPEIASIPGVQDVAAVNSIPMSLGKTEHLRYATRFGIVGTDFKPGQFPTAQIRWATANYLRVLGVPLLRGRFLVEEDHNQPRYVINDAFARRFFPHSDAVGKKILMDVVSPHPTVVEIVGVVGDVREFELTSLPEPTLYSVDVSPEMDVVVKAAGSNVISSIAATMRRINPQEAIGPVGTLAGYVADSLARQRFVLVLIATFAGLAIGLCAVGIYGVFSYSVSRRMREFGIRSAIGARRGNLLAQVLGECLIVVMPGSMIGMAISVGGSRFMRSLLFQVSATDPFSFGLAAALVLALCLLSVAIPALKAARVDPSEVLRAE